MTRVRDILAKVPPILAGASAAAVLELSALLLLYSDSGFLPALTLILTVGVGSLGLGIWSVSPLREGEGVEGLRQRWMLTLVAFALAAAYSAGIGFLGNLAVSAMGQGLGLALMCSFPLFALGSLFGAMASLEKVRSRAVPSLGASAILGAAFGFLLVGGLLLPNLEPYTLFLVTLVALSGSALLQGWVLDDRPVVALLEGRWTPGGELRLEDRVVGSPRREVRLLRVGGRLRGAEGPGGRPARRWEASLLEALQEDVGGSGEADKEEALYLGGGSGTLCRHLSEASPGWVMRIVEEDEGVVEAAREHFQHSRSGEEEGGREMEVHIGEPLGFLRDLEGPVSLVVVDSGALPSMGRLPALREEDWQALSDAVDTKGTVVMGGLHVHPQEAGTPIGEMIRRAGRWFARVELFEGGEDLEEGGDLGVGGGDAEGADALLVLSSIDAPRRISQLRGFRLRGPERG